MTPRTNQVDRSRTWRTAWPLGLPVLAASAAVVAALGGGCPTYDDRACNNDEDCSDGETCAAGTCQSGGGTGVSGSTSQGVASSGGQSSSAQGSSASEQRSSSAVDHSSSAAGGTSDAVTSGGGTSGSNSTASSSSSAGGSSSASGASSSSGPAPSSSSGPACEPVPCGDAGCCGGQVCLALDGGQTCECPAGEALCARTARCVGAAGCCEDAECGAGGTCGEPNNGPSVCQCPSPRKPCQGHCMDADACCTSEDCAPGKECSGPGGSCACTGGKTACGDTCVSGLECCPSVPCPAGLVCRAAGDTCTAGCLVDGVFRAPDERNPANACQSCQPGVSTAAWTERSAGESCTADELECTQDVCDGHGACTHPNATDGTPCSFGLSCQSGECGSGCTVGGVHYATGAPNPENECQSCQPPVSATAWTDKDAAASCTNDGNGCTEDHCNGAGTCVHPARAGGSSCGSGLVCQGTQCAEGCWMDGQLVAPGTANPLQECQSCQPGVSTGAWSNTPAPGTCTADSNPCTEDACNGSGTCVHPAKPDGTGCGSGLVCTAGNCGAGCFIGGVHRGSGEDNPANPCQSCQPGSSTNAWTDKSSTATCTGDTQECTLDVCDGAGQCVHPPKPGGTACGSGLVCNGGSCDNGCWLGGRFVESGADNPVNACQSCQPNRSVSTWWDKGATATCPADSNDCTNDWCDGAGSCIHPARGNGSDCGGGLVCNNGECGSGCTIDGVHRVTGEPNPLNECQACHPSLSTTAWSPKGAGTACAADSSTCTSDVCDNAGQCTHPQFANGTSCGAGQVCSGGTCTTGCWIAGTLVASGTPNAANECQSCQPTQDAFNWSNKTAGTACTADSNACTDDVCNGSGGCTHAALPNGTPCAAGQVCSNSTCSAGCWIGGQFYADGTANPGNDCAACASSANTTGWTNQAAGASCATDNNPCTQDVCNSSGSCTHSATGDGTSCGSGLVCTGGACSTGCWIGGQYWSIGTTNPSNECEYCWPFLTWTGWSPKNAGSACASDNNACTADVCNATGSCTHGATGDGNSCGSGMVCTGGACSTGCWIGGQYWSIGTTNPSNECEYCWPFPNGTGWSPKISGTGCASDGDVCTDDVCNAAGACTHPVRADGAQCGTGGICWGGDCVAGCFISGQHWAAGATNPDNACTECRPPTSTSGWSNKPMGESCTEDGLPCTSDVCNGSGSCTHPAAPDGTACTAGVCVSQLCTPGCWINGAFHGQGDVPATNACLVCDPSASVDQWTAQPDGFYEDGFCKLPTHTCMGGTCAGAYCNGTGQCGYTCQAGEPSASCGILP